MRCASNLGWLSAVFLLLTGAGGGEVRAQSGPTTVFVIDGSGSMWGNLGLERISKFDATREALRQSLATLAPDARTGLLSFGHRRKSDCSDTETIAFPEAGPPDRIPGLVDKLNPKGKGPLVLALREAAKVLASSAPASIILVHDGMDNCLQDPCAAAAEIAKANPRLAIHVVSIALEKTDLQRMSCVPRATKGKLFDVRDMPSLKASLDEAVRLANLEQPVPPAPEAAPRPTSEKTLPIAPGLNVTAALAADGPALATPVAWQVFKDAAAKEAMLVKTAPALSEQVGPGTYVVEARVGLASAREFVEVGPEGARPVRIALNAGTLQLAVRAGKDGGTPANATISIARTKDGEDPGTSSPEPVWIGRDADAALVVPAGTYVVRAEEGLARREATVAVKPGASTDIPLTLGTGRLELSALTREGGETVDSVIFLVAEDDPDAPQGRREIARSAASNADFVLAAGTYYVTAKRDSVEVRDRIAIGIGDVVKHGVVLDTGNLYLASQLGSTVANSGLPVTFRVLRVEGGSLREVASSTAPNPVFLLAGGRYRAEAQLGTLNVKSAADFDVAPGKDVKLTLKLDAGSVTIRPGAAAGEASRWQVRDASGKIVLRSAAGEPKTAHLAPGRYVVQHERGDRRAETPFDLKIGEQRTVDLVL